MGYSRADLRAFLIEARARISPTDVGLPTGERRRVRGLRREEVAELAGMSEGWYTRFEAGRASLSLPSLERVADALRLSAARRARLFELARPELSDLAVGGAADSFTGIGSATRILRKLALACNTTSREEIAAHATRAVRDLCGSGALGYMRAYDHAADDLPIIGASGPGDAALAGHRQSCASVAYAMQHFLSGRPFGEYDLRTSPCMELRTRIDRVGVYSYHTQPIMERGRLAMMLGLALREPRPPADIELRLLETSAAIAELALARE